MPTISKSQRVYVVTLIEKFSQKIWAYLFKQKNEVVLVFCDTSGYIELQGDQVFVVEQSWRVYVKTFVT